MRREVRLFIRPTDLSRGKIDEKIKCTFPRIVCSLEDIRIIINNSYGLYLHRKHD